MKLNFLTQNPFKIETAQLAFQPFDIEVIPLDFEIPEIQADSNLEIARHSALIAAQESKQPVIREDHGFFLNAFPGWPGPYMAHTERTIPPEDLLDLMNGKNRTGYFELALVYAEPSGETLEFVSRVECQIVSELRPGAKDWGWDSVISMGNDIRAISEYPTQDRFPLFTANFIELAKKLTNTHQEQ